MTTKKSIRIPEELYQEINSLAISSDITFSHELIRLIEKGLDNHSVSHQELVPIEHQLGSLVSELELKNIKEYKKLRRIHKNIWMLMS